MARPVYIICLGLMAALLASIVRGQGAPDPPTASAAPPAAAAAETPASPKLTKLFAGTPPKFEPPKAVTAAPAPASVPTTTDQPRNSIVRLPTFVVRGSYRLPDEYHMLTPQARQDAVVKRYVGEPTGLDLLLNKYTLNNTLWKKIPVLGTISNFGWSTSSGADHELGQVYSSSTPGDRIALDYSKIEAKRLYIEALGVSADVPPSPTNPKDEKSPSVPVDK